MKRPAHDMWHEVDALFRAVLQLSEADRATYLDRECEDRPDLRREVESLLEASRREAGWVDRLGRGFRDAAWDLIPETEETPEAREADEPPGKRIGRYRIVRRLARGGMGTVYLAERADGAFERQVALKLLRRGLDTDDVLERFRRERQILAGLEHPHIARLIDGGATEDGRPYLVMEYVPGTSITEYCDSERLDVSARLRLFLMVCGAVQYAHRQEIIHRDLKPSNILVDEARRVHLVDFGIAKLLAAEPDAVRTSTGLRLMTPESASPEQARGAVVGAASDIYQLGLLLHELLTGQPVHQFTSMSPTEIERVVCRGTAEAPSARVKRAAPGELTEIVRARSTEPRRLRHRLRGDLDTIVLKALRLEPDRRYESAEAMARDVAAHLEGHPITARRSFPTYRAGKLIRRHVGLVVALVAAAVLALLAVTILPRIRSTTPANLTGDAVAVLPFRTGGADPALEYLREGMVDLLAAKLTGEGGPRALPAASVLSSWRGAGGDADTDLPLRQAIELAGDLGAIHLLTGEVVGTQASAILSASLVEVSTGEARGRATVEGPVDSLSSLVDRLTGQLLLVGAGDREGPRTPLVSASLPALRAYLDGEAAYRRAHHDEAYRYFNRAVEFDSSFAVAAVRAYRAGWLSGRSGDQRLLDVAWSGREGLSELDRVYVTVYLGPAYPRPYSQTERLAQRMRLVELSPDRVDSQYMLGDRLLHWGPFIGVEDAKELALRRFQRALALDSAHTPIYRHLIPLLYSMEETEAATGLAQAYLRRQPTGGISEYVRWRVAANRRDEAALIRVRAGMDTLPDIELLNIVRTAVSDAVSLDDAGWALASLRDRPLSPAVESRTLREQFVYELARGRPRTAARMARQLGEVQELRGGPRRLEYRTALVTSALFGDGDADAATRARAALASSVFLGDGSIRPGVAVGDLCTVLHAAAWDETLSDAHSALARLRGYDRSGPAKDSGVVCALLLEAVLATGERLPEAPALLARLDSALATGPQILVPDLSVPANLAAVRLHELQGNPRGALAAVRRRIYNFDATNFLLAAALREEGRLAARTGDLQGAEEAYRHYLALRDDPEPRLRPQVDSVRAELDAVRARRR